MREKTGASVMECRRALLECGGDFEKAIDYLKKRGSEKALKKAERKTTEGVIAAYIHSNKKIGAMVELRCETDFVARNAEFGELAYDIAMHVAAMGSVDADSLLAQPFIKNENVTIDSLVKEKISKLGENIQIGSFARFEI